MNCPSSHIKRIAFSAFFIFLLGLTYLLQNASGKLYLGMTGPSFTLNDLGGKSQTLNNLSKELTTNLMKMTLGVKMQIHFERP